MLKMKSVVLNPLGFWCQKAVSSWKLEEKVQKLKTQNIEKYYSPKELTLHLCK